MTLYHRVADIPTTESLLREACTLLHNVNATFVPSNDSANAMCVSLCQRITALIAELRAAAQQSALDELVRENERLGLYDDQKPAQETESVPLYLAPAPAQSRQPLSEWIACDDRLPDNNTHCFVVGPRFNDYRRGQYTAEALFIDGKFFSHDEGDDLYTPSHWFPIPTLPAAPERAITGEKS